VIAEVRGRGTHPGQQLVERQLLADEPGLGKTAQALLAAEAAGAFPLVVVVPNVVKVNWAREVERCLNCDIQTVFVPKICIECDACVDICPTECITFTRNGDEAELRTRLKAPAPNLDQALYVSDPLKTRRIMVKDENLCLHCSLCAERCPTGAWDMQKFLLDIAHAGAEVRKT